MHFGGVRQNDKSVFVVCVYYLVYFAYFVLSYGTHQYIRGFPGIRTRAAKLRCPAFERSEHGFRNSFVFFGNYKQKLAGFRAVYHGVDNFSRDKHHDKRIHRKYIAFVYKCGNEAPTEEDSDKETPAQPPEKPEEEAEITEESESGDAVETAQGEENETEEEQEENAE